MDGGWWLVGAWCSSISSRLLCFLPQKRYAAWSLHSRLIQYGQNHVGSGRSSGPRQLVAISFITTVFAPVITHICKYARI